MHDDGSSTVAQRLVSKTQVVGRCRGGQLAIAALALGAFLTLLSACSSSSIRSHASTPTAAQLAEGRRLFAGACGACHTLTGHDTHADGGDLGLLHMTQAQMLSFALIMPNPKMSSDKLRIIVRYVVTVEADDAKLRSGGATASP